MTATAHRIWRTVTTRARDLVGVNQRAIVASAMTDAQRSLAVRHRDAALRRVRAADHLIEADQAVAALRLYREGLQLMAAAIIGARDGADPEQVRLAAESPREALIRLAQSGAIPPLPAEVERAAQFLSPSPSASLLAFDDEAPDQALIKRDEAALALKWLRALIDLRTPQAIRVGRIRMAVLAGLAVLAGVVWGVRTLSPRNLARDRPVTISARHPRSGAPADNHGLVNGEIETTYGVHTGVKNAWVLIDLGDQHAISSVKIYNRADCCQNEGLPLILELLEDGGQFTEVERRTVPFTSTDPWVFQAQGRKASAVRIRSATYIALTEVEIYGR